MNLENILPRFSYFGLLTSLAIFFLVTPFFSEGTHARLALDLSLLSLLIISVYMCSDNKRNVIFATLLALPALARLIYPTVEVDEVSLISNAALFGFVIYVLMKKIFKTSQVTSDLIYAAISVYFLIAIFWGIVYTLLEFHWPGSYQLESNRMVNGFYTEFGQDLIYYSFVTLTTVGFGDIVSLSKPAKALSALEAFMGQIYLTVLVARLVGMHISQSKS